MAQSQAQFSTTPDRLRAVIAETIEIDALALQTVVGQLVVATSAQHPAAPGDARSVHDAVSRVTVLLADRIPFGEEANALASEISLHFGRETAHAIIGERFYALVGSPSVEVGLKSEFCAEEQLEEMPAHAIAEADGVEVVSLANKLIRADGTLKALTFGRPQGKRGGCLQISLPKLGINKSLSVEGRDFDEIYAKAVAIIADAKGVRIGTPTHLSMLETKTAFLEVNGIELMTVAYKQFRTADMEAVPGADKSARIADQANGSRNEQAVAQLYSCLWPCRFDGAGNSTMTRVVVDGTGPTLVAAQKWMHGEFRAFSNPDEFDYLQSDVSFVHQTQNATIPWGLARINELPQWALSSMKPVRHESLSPGM